MTKSRGNVVDPLEIMEKYGTDAVRFTLAQLAVQGRDLILSDDRLAASRAFANKIWNAARFVHDESRRCAATASAGRSRDLALAERWILRRLDNAIREVTSAIDAYEFNVAALIALSVSSGTSSVTGISSWPRIRSRPAANGRPRALRAGRCFDGLLRLLHPFMPFISEEIWQALRPYFDEPTWRSI